jgi:hypothetical protein
LTISLPKPSRQWKKLRDLTVFIADAWQYFASQWVLPEKGLDESSWLYLQAILSLRYTHFQSSGRLHSTFSFCSEKCTQWSLCTGLSFLIEVWCSRSLKIFDNSWNFETSKLFSLNVQLWKSECFLRYCTFCGCEWTSSTHQCMVQDG